MDKNLDKNFEENLKRGRLLINHLEETQYSYFNGRPEWITLQINDLKLFLAHIYYGNPSPSNAIAEKNYENDYNSEEIFNLYEKELKKKILNIYNLIEEKYINPGLFSKINVGLTMVHSICNSKSIKCDSCQNFPKKDIHKWILLRLKLVDNTLIFIDFLNGRIYTDWDQYIENNNLPEGFMFYPKSGFYDASKTLYQGITPASKKTEKVFKIADIGSNVLFYVGGILLSCGGMFPVAVPIITGVAGSVLLTASSSYQCGRDVQRLIDMFKHDIDKSDTRAWKQYISLVINALGAITAPIHGIAAITSNVDSTIQSTNKALTIIQKSALITQCTLEVFRATLDFIDNNYKLTWEIVLKMRLDLFVVTGSLMPPSCIKNILKIMATKTVWAPIYNTMKEIPYCLAKHVWTSVYFFKDHFGVFVEQVKTFLAENLTVNNLMLAWKTIRPVFDHYQKQTLQLDVGDLLRHMVDDYALDESVKYVLRGQCMLKLLDSLRDFAPKKQIHRALVKYCVDHVLRKAMELSANRDDCMDEMAKHSLTDAWRFDEEFCECYGLGRCAMDQYVLWAIGQVNMDTLMAEYKEHASRPENMFDDELVNNSDSNGCSAKGYTFVAPCGVLDLKMCMEFAEKVNPQPQQYTDHNFVQREPDVSLMFSVSAYSVNIVFFGIDLIDGVPKMNICFFEQNNDSRSASFANHKGYRKLLAA